MQEIWKRIDTWLLANAKEIHDNFRRPATEEQIKALEIAIQCQLPEDLKSSLLIHNGQVWNQGGYMPFDLVHAHDLNWFFLSTSDIEHEWISRNQLPEDYPEEDDDLDNSDMIDVEIKECWWNQKWIPIMNNGFPHLLCIDLDASEKGITGQVIKIYSDDPSLTVIASSYHEFLEKFANDLEAGKYSVGEYGLHHVDDKE